MRLNKFLAKSGVASRRKSDELIQMATTEVNGKVCLDPAYNVTSSDSVYFDGKIVKLIENKSDIVDANAAKILIDNWFNKEL